jgi:hypothetical protein
MGHLVMGRFVMGRFVCESISLLSNMYKIISRAINARLNKVVIRICSRATTTEDMCRKYYLMFAIPFHTVKLTILMVPS